MSAVMNTIGVAFAYAVLALFAQNAIFTRGLGVSRLIQLVGDERTSSWWFALLLCVTQTLVAPLAYFAGSQIVDLPYRAQLRPLLYLACVAVVCIFEHAILRAVKGHSHGQHQSIFACGGKHHQRSQTHALHDNGVVFEHPVMVGKFLRIAGDQFCNGTFHSAPSFPAAGRCIS